MVHVYAGVLWFLLSTLRLQRTALFSQTDKWYQDTKSRYHHGPLTRTEWNTTLRITGRVQCSFSVAGSLFAASRHVGCYAALLGITWDFTPVLHSFAAVLSRSLFFICCTHLDAPS